MTAPKAILYKGQVILFTPSDRACITSKAASYAYHNQSDFRRECYNCAREYAAKHYCNIDKPAYTVEFSIKRKGCSDRETYRYTCLANSSGVAERLGMDYLDSATWVESWELLGVLHYPDMLPVESQPSVSVGQTWYNPQGYFSLKVIGVNDTEATLTTDDPRDCDRTVTIDYILKNWVLLS